MVMHNDEKGGICRICRTQISEIENAGLAMEFYSLRRPERLGAGSGKSKKNPLYYVPIVIALALNRWKAVVTIWTLKNFGNIWKCGNFATVKTYSFFKDPKGA